jgi:hypothetical protein
MEFTPASDASRSSLIKGAGSIVVLASRSGLVLMLSRLPTDADRSTDLASGLSFGNAGPIHP